MENGFIRESLLGERVGNKVRCNVCERRCLLVAGGTGWCRTRRNLGGQLQTLIYGNISSIAANPIEKKPFYHFLPGCQTLTAGSWSCNFGCPWCQNYEITKTPPPARGNLLSPEQFISLVDKSGCQGTCISFNEPTLSLEWSLDVFRLARARGYHNTFVTNGFMTPEALFLLVQAGMDAMNVDIKGDAAAVKKYCRGIDVEKVWQNCRQAIKLGVHIELTTLIIPSVNDSEPVLRGIAGRIAQELGAEVPWHVSGYYPAYHFDAPPTRMQTLVRARDLGKEEGLEFVYTGNLPGHRYDNTYCPQCGEMLVRRLGYEILSNRVRQGECPECGCKIPGTWERQPCYN